MTEGAWMAFSSADHFLRSVFGWKPTQGLMLAFSEPRELQMHHGFFLMFVQSWFFYNQHILFLLRRKKINGKASIIWASDDKSHSSPGSTRHSLRPEEDRVHLDTRAIKLCGTTITVLWRCFGCQDESQRKLAMASHKGLNRFMPQTHTASTNHICNLPCLIGPHAWGGRQYTSTSNCPALAGHWRLMQASRNELWD